MVSAGQEFASPHRDMLRLWLTVVLTCVCAACASRQQPSPETDLRAEVEAMREAVAQRVPDAQRAAQLNKALDGYEKELLSFGTAFAAFRSSALALNSRPDATRAEFDSLVDGFDRERKASRMRLLQLHSRMIAATTAEEWKTLAKHERAVLTTPALEH